MESEEKPSVAESGAAAANAGPALGPPVDWEKRGHTWGTLAHLSALVGFVGIPFGHFLGPLIVWLATRDRYPFADDQGKEAINFQLSILVYTLGSMLLICLCVGIVLILAIHLFNLVFIVVATVRAAGGERYRYPLTIRFIR